MIKNPYTINGLKLPSKLVELLKNDEWKAPEDKSGIEKILTLPDHLKDRFDAHYDFDDFETYDLRLMTNETLWHKQHSMQDPDTNIMFKGAHDEIAKPGVIDFDKIIFIADLGHGSDSPFTLDYRKDINNPSVMIIWWGEDMEKDNRWITIADSFEEFIEVTGISPQKK